MYCINLPKNDNFVSTGLLLLKLALHRRFAGKDQPEMPNLQLPPVTINRTWDSQVRCNGAKASSVIAVRIKCCI